MASRCSRPGALFIDVGGGTTDVALVRQGGIEGTRMFALGGRAFTKSLADRLELPFARAEELKVDFAEGMPGRARATRSARSSARMWPCGRRAWSWCSRSSASSGMLPGRIYLCGGGARLPQIAAALRDPALARNLPFARPPQVQASRSSRWRRPSDATGLLVDEQDITPMALAHQALEMTAAEAPLDAALRRVLRQMKV